MDVALYTTRVMGASHVENVAHLACRSALSRRGVAHINFPVDLQEQEASKDERSKRNVPGHNVEVFACSAGLPVDRDLRRAAEGLHAGAQATRRGDRGW